MNELSAVASIRKWTRSARSAGVVAGIGDDCAILRPAAGRDLIVTTDFVIEDVHFVRAKQTGTGIGWKALARGLSDIAAMGGRPRYALFSIAAAPWTCTSFLADFYRGVRLLAEKHRVAVVGGDLTRAKQFCADVVVIGDVARGKALRRNGAKPGDVIYVSGPLGRAAACGYIERPEPRIALGQRLARLKATSCMDLSDGLALDLHRLCVESGVAAELDGVLPAANGATLEQALSGGEDYELLCTLPAKAKVPRELIRVGAIVKGRPGAMRFGGVKLEPRGWDPLQTPGTGKK